MISIHNNMRSHGFATEDAPHTRIPGVWRKLHQLYDLHALDEREDAYTFQELPDPTNSKEHYDIPSFELPEDDFGELIWRQRFHGPESVGSSSPPLIPVEEEKALYAPGFGLLKDLPDGAKSQKAESIAEATPTPKNAKTTRASRAAAKSAKGTKTGGQAEKKNSKAQSAVSESADEDDEDEEDEEAESSEESEADTAPSTRRTNRSAAKAKQVVPKRRGKR
jgi:MRG-binding protein